MKILLLNTLWLILLLAIPSANTRAPPDQLDILATEGSGGVSQQQTTNDGSEDSLMDLELIIPTDNKTDAGEVEARLDNPYFFEGDLNITQEQIMEAYQPHLASNVREKRGARNGRQWPNGVMCYDFDSSVTCNPSLQGKIRAAIREYERETCLRFIKSTAEGHYILFTTQGSGCSSDSVGKKGGRQIITLPSGCQTHGIIVHEIGHAIGFWHEQSRPDRDHYINIHRGNIQSGRSHNFETRSDVDYQGEPYDYQSVMHYSEYAFSSNGQKTITPKKSGASINTQHIRLSQSDITQINRMYHCPQASAGHRGVLKVKMVCATDLPDTDRWRTRYDINRRFIGSDIGRWLNEPDPYACVEAVDQGNYHRRLCTRVISSNRYPTWNQELNFGTSSSGWRYFTITIWDQDSGRDDQMMGTQTVYVRPGRHSEKYCTSLTRCVYFEPNMTVDGNDCIRNPCLNGGTCYDLVFDYRCSCRSWYYGKRCEYRRSSPTPHIIPRQRDPIIPRQRDPTIPRHDIF